MTRRTPRPECLFPLAVALVLATAACGKDKSTTSTTTPSVVITTETFTGTVLVGGRDFHSFTVAQTGQVDVTLTAAGPPSTISMGLGVGTTSGSTCALLLGGSTSTQAGTSAQISGKVSPGAFCVDVYDIGNETASISYMVTVAHP